MTSPTDSPPPRLRLEDVAQRVGLSTATVSLVLNGADGPSQRTRERVLAAAADLGYRPDRAARQLARRSNRLIGVTMDLRSTFHAELVEEVQAAADDVDHDLVLSPVTRRRDEGSAVETLLDFRCGALVLLGPVAPVEELTDLARRLPVVVIGRHVAPAPIDAVRTADDEGIERAVEHLVALGHREISYVDGGAGAIAADRRRGYLSSVERHALRPDTVPGDATEEGGLRAAQLLARRTNVPTAVVAFNDRTAVGLEEGLTRAGLHVPGAVSIVGYDDSPLSRLAHINLTTVNQDAAGQAREAVRIAVERLQGADGDPVDILLTPRLVVRGTTAAPRRS